MRDNIAFALKLKKMPKDEINERVDNAARILELTENLDRKPGQLSGGQRQRVAMGRAIVRQPQAFLMDEPLSNLDAKLRVQMRAEVSKLQHTLNVTTVYVTHDQIEAMTMGDRVAVLSRGVLQQVGTPQDLYDHPDNLFVGAFIGSPQMNLLEATVSSNGGGTTLKFGSSTLTVPASVLAKAPSLAGYDGRRVAVGIRPEHLTRRHRRRARHDQWLRRRPRRPRLRGHPPRDHRRRRRRHVGRREHRRNVGPGCRGPCRTARDGADPASGQASPSTRPSIHVFDLETGLALV